MSDKPSKVAKHTARISTMRPYQATKGRRLARRNPDEKLNTAPAPQKRITQAPSPDYSSSEPEDDPEEPPEDDPEDDPDNYYALPPKRRRVDDESDDESDNASDESDVSKGGYPHDRVDESDEEELGDQDRRSPDSTPPYWMDPPSCESATDDGDDSNF